MRVTKDDCEWLLEPLNICQNSGLPCEKHKNCMKKRKLRAMRQIRNFRPGKQTKERKKDAENQTPAETGA